jgi:hypothetical protein
MEPKGGKMRVRSVLRLGVAAVATTSVVASTLIAEVASAAPIDRAVELTYGQQSDFKDESGAPIQITSDEDRIGERYISGLESTGAPAAILLYKATSTQAAVPAASDTAAQPFVTAQGDWDGDVAAESVLQANFPVNQPDLRGHLASATTATTVTLAWDGATGPYSVLQDGQLVGTTSQRSYSATGLTPATTYTFRIQGSTTGPSGEVTDFAVDLPLQTLANVLRSASDTTARSLAATAQAANYQKVSTEFVYGTFIPDAKVSGGAALPCTGNAADAFSGDARSWKKPDGTAGYRTGMQVSVNWRDGRMSTTKWDNPSTLIRSNGSKETKRASMANMLFQDRQMGGAYAQVRFNHRAGNPFCSAGAITYNVIVRLYRSGLVEVVGHRYPVPNHEGWVRWDGTYNWNNIFKYNNEGFGCLIGACGYRTVSSSLQR